jgi:hypothetical protein
MYKAFGRWYRSVLDDVVLKVWNIKFSPTWVPLNSLRCALTRIWLVRAGIYSSRKQEYSSEVTRRVRSLWDNRVDRSGLGGDRAQERANVDGGSVDQKYSNDHMPERQVKQNCLFQNSIR